MATGKGTTSRPARLQFKQKLVSSQKPFSTAELLKRLKNLFGEVSVMDQDQVDLDSLKGVTRDLINANLIGHKDWGVRAYVACCISDLLRLYAPDAPYTVHELKDIFVFFVRQLQNIANKDGPYFDLYFHLLENLARVKIVLLILDLQNYEELLTELFRDFFDIIRSDMSNIVQSHMIDILEQLINESNGLPQDDENPAAYKLASEVCRHATDKLQRYVCQVDVIVAAGKNGTSAEELNDFKTAHDLIKELNRTAPGLLLNVIPQLEEELKLDDTPLRLLATQVLGEMFSEKNSTLASRYDNVWKMWLLRRNDKIPDVRCAWTEYCLPLYINHHELAKQINEAIISKISDPDDKVRVAVCKVFGQLEYECASKLVGKELFIELAKRCRDRKHGVRQEAIKALARLYNMAYIEIVDHDANAIEKFGWIPSEILNILYIKDNEINVCVEKAMYEEILTSNNGDSARMDRIIVVFGSLDPKAKKGFFSLFQRQREYVFCIYLYEFLSWDDSNNEDSEKLSNILNQVIERISGKLPDSEKSKNHLSAFAKLRDTRVYKLIRDCMNPQSDYKTVRKSAKDAIKHIEQIAASSLETFSILIRRVSLTTINRDLVPLLMNKIKSVDGEQQNEHSIIAHELFTDISSRFPAIFRSHFEKLTTLLKEEDESSMIVEDSLEALSKLAKAFPDEAYQDSETIQRYMQFALNGSPRQAKFAAIILTHIRQKQQLCSDLFKKIIPNLMVTSPNILSYLSVLSQCALYMPTTYEQQSDTITNFIVKELIMKNRNKATPGDKAEWVDDDELDDECKAKVLGLKVLVNRLLAIAETESAQDLAKPVFKLLWTLIRGGGELISDKSTRPSFQSRLRLVAVHSVLKLARKKIYDSMISAAELQELALMIQDPCYHVRFAFASRLIKYCGGYHLNARFLSIFFLIAHDPDETIREMVKVFLIRHSLASKAIRDKSMHFEMSLVRLIHLLSHHPDFSREPDILNEFVAYIDFFLDTIANAENVSFLLYITGRLKQVRDAQTLDQSENLYALSDLTEYLIRIKCKSCSWSLPTFPGHVKLPEDLFKNLPNPEVISEIMKKSYIPSEFLKILEKRHASTHSKSDKPKTIRKGRKTSSQAPKKKRKINADTRGTPSISTRKSVPRAAKSNIKSMAVISTSSDDDSEKSNDVSEASDIEMKDSESSNVNQSEQGHEGSEYDEMDIEPK
ncbi:17009_t:CDS:10, partial [Rhizophagus irregularis]